jgi:Tfp pilus assembly protein PilP
MRRTLIRALVVGSLLGLGLGARAGEKGENDEQPARPAPPNLNAAVKQTVKDALPAGKGAAAAPAQSDAAAALAGRLALLRRKTLKDEDFQDNDERNRDPFRSYMRLFIDSRAPRAIKVPAVFDKFALEELTLIGIVSGDATPRAMFRDPAGLGQSVTRGQYISKAAARVSKILSDRVILELTEVSPDGETRSLEKPVLVNPEGAQK